MSQLPIQQLPPNEPIEYPESDGQPMAETPEHGELMVDVKRRLDHRYRDRADVRVGMNLFLYYVEGDPRKVVSPDVYVTIGIPKASQRTYKVWFEGKAPDVVFEVTSPSTRANDLGRKKDVYERIGVREYFLVDPLQEYLSPPLKGFRRVGCRLEPILGPELESDILDIIVSLQEGRLTLTDRTTGALVPTPEEEQTARADSEATRADKAEASQAEADAEWTERLEALAQESRTKATEDAATVKALMAKIEELQERLSAGATDEAPDGSEP